MGNWFAKLKEINIVQEKTEVRAGTSQKFCTLVIALDDPDSWDGLSQNGLPTVDCIGCDEVGDIIEVAEWTRNADGLPEMAICMCANKAGPRRAQLKFTPKVRIKESNCSVEILDVPLTVKIPASCQHSRMTQESQQKLDRIKSSKFEAGEKVVFQLQVYDIFGNALSHADNGSTSSVKFHVQLKPKTSENEQTESEDQLTDQAWEVNDMGSKSNLYEIKFVPRVAGKHELDFRIGGDSVNRFPVSFEVVPARIYSLCSEIASKVWVRNKEILKVTAFDRFKNVVSLNKQFHELEISSPNSDEVKISVFPMTTVDGKCLCRGVMFHTTGEHNVRVSLRTTSHAHDAIIVTQKLSVNVMLPPISFTQSPVLCASSMATTAGEPADWYEDEPVFENSKTFFTIKLKEALGDNYIIIEPSEIKTQINGKEKRMHDLEVDSDTVKFEISDIGDAGEKLLEVVLREKCIMKLWINVVGVQDMPKESLRRDGKHFALRCEGFERYLLTGPNSSHIDNINRAYPILVGQNDSKILDASTNTARKVHELVSLNFKGSHFRRQAWKFDSERRKWQERAKVAHDKEQYDKASFSKRTKETYRELMSKAHAKASESIFDFYNCKRSQSEIDLHELLVADEEKIEEYQQQLQNDPRYKRHDIDRMISEKRDNDNEALRKLQHRLENAHAKASESIFFGPACLGGCVSQNPWQKNGKKYCEFEFDLQEIYVARVET